MPRPNLPMTPAASTDITGQEKNHTPTESSFTLGPPAIYGDKDSESPPSNASVQSDSSYHPNSPALAPATVNRKRPRASLSQPQHNTAFSLPPPPSRSRKIIQMKPGSSNPTKPPSSSSYSSSTSAVAAATAMPSSDSAKAKATNAKSNAKAASSTSTSSKKTARKTAHSVIERRRRSKMNEEFDTMKEMIPACRGQAMHKLAILQAGIDYLRYLENCVRELKAANERAAAAAAANAGREGGVGGTVEGSDTPRAPRSPATSPEDVGGRSSRRRTRRGREEDAIEDEDDEDDYDSESDPETEPSPALAPLDNADTHMADADGPSSFRAHTNPQSQHSSTSAPTASQHLFTFVPSTYSPSVNTLDSTSTFTSHSTTAPTNSIISRSSTLSLSSSGLPSPAFKPLSDRNHRDSIDFGSSYAHSVESSPALLPQGRTYGGSGSTSGSFFLGRDARSSRGSRGSSSREEVEEQLDREKERARERDDDREATAALLMLGAAATAAGTVNAGVSVGAEVRKGRGRGPGGLSVQDLLSG